jgi:hypothetical protein
LRFWCAISILQKDRVDDRQVGIRSQPCGAFRGQPLHVAAKADVVEDGLVMGGKQIDQRGRERRAEHIGNVNACASAGCQQAAVLQLGHRLSQAGAGHAKPSESSRSDGRRSPGRRMPRRIRSSICVTTAWASFSEWTFWNGM